MRRYLAFIGGVVLIMIGVMLPLLVARLTVELEIRFWLATFITFIAFMFITPVFLFFAAVIIGPSFPGIASKINGVGENASNSFVHFLFKIRFAGKDSYWQQNEGVQATVIAGVWHGMIFPITFIFSYFSDRITIYEGVNSGFAYNYGFITGAIGIIRFLLDPYAFLEGSYLVYATIIGLTLIFSKVAFKSTKL